MIWIIGSGNMASQYARVLTYKKIKFQVIGRSKKSCDRFSKENDISVFSGGIENFLSKNYYLPDYAIVCVNINSLYKVTMKLMSKGIKKILCEKPGSLNINDLKKLNQKSIKENTDIFIAYNRRFYGSVSKLRNMIKLDNGLNAVHFDFTEKSKKIKNLKHPKNVKSRWVIANSAHVIDIVFFLSGFPSKFISYHEGGLSWHKKSSIFLGSGMTKKNVYFTYNSNWNIEGNWKIEFMTKKNRLLLEPMEDLKVIKENSKYSLLNNKKINYDKMFKPGLYRMLSKFHKSDYQDFCSLSEQIELIKICNRIAGY